MKALIMACLDRETPEYLQVAGKLYMADLYKRVFKSDTPFTLKDHIKKMQDLDYYRTWDYTEEEINIIDSYLDHKSDFNTSYTSIKQFETKYFVKDVSLGQTYETPQFLYARIAMTILEKEENRLEKIKEYLALLRSKKLSLPSPNWEYIGTKKGMATSCCLYTCEDTSSSITALNLITDIMNTPFRNPLYSKINTVGRTWIYKYTLAISREIEAHIRIQTANQNIQGIGPLQGSELITDARTEKENLITELKEMLNETSRRGQLERKQQESQFHRDTLQQIPLPIYIL